MTNAELSLNTKRALATALKKIMETKTLSKITVSELIRECNVNRKTFYYHFEDIYALLKWMLEQEAFEVVKNFNWVDSTEDAFRFVMNYVDENKHIINCAYDSMGYEEMMRFLYNDFYDIVRNNIEINAKSLSLDVDESFKDFLTKFFTNAIAGILIEWTKNKLSQDREIVLQDLMTICTVSIPEILKTKYRN